MKRSGQNMDGEQMESEMGHPSGDGSGSTPSQEPQTLAIGPPASRGLADRKATGPRTELGKQKASRNSTKHGVFSKVVVLLGESRDEYERLLAGLRKALQPKGALEELLVEKLATIAWRQRRLLLAEAAEIRKNMKFVESDQRDRERKEAERVGSLRGHENKRGLIREIQNPFVLERCLELLTHLRKQILKKGLNRQNDYALLEKIYGGRDENRLCEDLYDSYEIWLQTSEAPEEECVRKGYASPAQCWKSVLVEIDQEIRRLNSYQATCTSLETSRTQLEVLRRSVPDAPGLGRLLRYEASLERSFDRTLTQLERLQRTRRGQLVPPPLKVELS